MPSVPMRLPKPAISTFQDADGREIGNIILSNLPRAEFAELSPYLEFVRLKLRQVLHETGETIRSVYFLNDGMGSVLRTVPCTTAEI